MLSRSVTVALLWMLASGPLAPAGAQFPPTVEDAIQHVTADELRAHITLLASDKADFTELAARLAWMAADGDAPRFKAQ